MEEDVVLALSYNGAEFFISGEKYEDLGYHDTYLDTEENIIYRKEVDGDIPIIDLQSIEVGESYNLIDLI